MQRYIQQTRAERGKGHRPPTKQEMRPRKKNSEIGHPIQGRIPPSLSPAEEQQGADMPCKVLPPPSAPLVFSPTKPPYLHTPESVEFFFMLSTTKNRTSGVHVICVWVCRTSAYPMQVISHSLRLGLCMCVCVCVSWLSCLVPLSPVTQIQCVSWGFGISPRPFVNPGYRGFPKRLGRGERGRDLTERMTNKVGVKS